MDDWGIWRLNCFSMNPPDFSFALTAAGDSQWFRDVSAPLAKELEGMVPFNREELPEPLRVRTGITTNDLTSFVMLGITFFVANRLGGKALDDAYTHLIQPRFTAFLAKIDKKLNGGNRKAKKVFSVNRWYAEHKVLVSVSVVGSDFDEVIKQLDLVPTVHSRAIGWITANGARKPIHYYRIEDGKVSPVPMLFDRIEETLLNS
jgi:hypothetical protein